MSWFGRTPREEPPPLDGPLAALIEAEQIEVRAAEDVRARVLQRARSTPQMRLRVVPQRFWSRARAAAAAAIVFSLGVAASAAWRLAERSEPHPAPAPSPAVRAPAPRPEAVEPPEIVEAPAPRAPAPRRPARAHQPADSMVPAAEIALLEKARAAIAGRSFAAALIPLAEHARQFPAGHLLEEREALRIRALTGLDRRAEARRAAAAFRARFPHSILLRRIDELASPGD